MRLFRFDPDVARPVTDDGSSFRLSRLLLSRAGEVRVGALFLGPGDRVGRHPAGLPQLFCVVDGRERVRGDAGESSLIAQGQAAFWRSGEDHEAGTETGMTAVVVQAEALDPDAVLSPL